MSLKRCLTLALPVLAWVVSPVKAGYTPVSAPPYAEETQAQIMGHSYGGTFHSTGPLGLDYTNGVLHATRVQDFVTPTYSGPQLTQPLSIVGSVGTDDQIWTADFTLATAQARFAVYAQNFGYYSGLNGTTYNKLFDQNGIIYNTAGNLADLSALSGQTVRWARGGEGRVVSSRASDNADGLDHMVTYQIEPEATSLSGSPAVYRWLIFFEDKFQGEQLADFDYNDLVVEITATRSATLPEPTSLATLAAGGVLALRRRRRA